MFTRYATIETANNMTAEFDLIAKYFTRPTSQTVLGIGDDAALLEPSAGQQLVVSSDMSVADTHFFADATPHHIGWKSLAVNISDMAAMGAKPKWATLALALPNHDNTWLSEFARGLFECAERFKVDLIGGDTTKGPLNITIQIMGEVPTGQALKRSGAQVGDDIWVSGYLGSAALGLAHLTQTQTIKNEDTLQACLNALHLPQPRSSLGIDLRGIAHSCIDISDGVLADLSHILTASNIGAAIELANIPCLEGLKTQLDKPAYQQAILAGGDDYELCFTAPADKRDAIMALVKQHNIQLTRIGVSNASGKLSVTYNGNALSLTSLGYDHFS